MNENRHLPALQDSNLSHLLFSESLKGGSLPSTRRRLNSSDISLIICIRAHEKNPWVIDRLQALSDHYDELPNVIIVDFGSLSPFSERISQICRELGFTYQFVEDFDTYSASSARNAGFQVATTELIFFTDIDFVYPANFFTRLCDIASNLQMHERIDVVLMCSAVHLNENATAEYIRRSPGDRTSYIESIGHRSALLEFGGDVQFVAPYSNNFLIHRSMFSLVGGYDERFRGHGSEDFEFISRLNCYTKQFPAVANVTKDIGGPLREEFFDVQAYEGFRALNALTCFSGELQGLRAYHLYHPTRNDDDWRSNNDWKRDRLVNIMAGYTPNQSGLLKVDYVKRPKKLLCICNQDEHWGYFVPLRLLGYTIHVLSTDKPNDLSEASSAIKSGFYDAVAVFNPYMKSHAPFKPVFMLAKEFTRTIVIERGALPGTIYYASDVAYNASEFDDEGFESYTPTNEDLDHARSYIKEIRKGHSSLEKLDSYEDTLNRYEELKHTSKIKIFIPLQLSEDMAVTMFVRDAQSYPEFESYVAKLGEVRGVTFLVKPHPLSKGKLDVLPDNVVLLRRDDNIHAVIDIADAVVAYNSGVSLLAMAHEKPVYTVGNAYFNRGGAGKRADSLIAAVADFKASPWKADTCQIARVYAWLLCRMYSRFSATDDIREFASRLAHGYRDIVVEELRLGDEAVALHRLIRGSERGATHTYAFGRLNLKPSDASRPSSPTRAIELPVDKYERWARDDFHSGRFEASARNFRMTFKEQGGGANVSLLRCAAEAYANAGLRREAIDVLKEVSILLPQNKAVRKRLIVMTYPFMALVFGRKPFIVRKHKT